MNKDDNRIPEFLNKKEVLKTLKELFAPTKKAEEELNKLGIYLENPDAVVKITIKVVSGYEE